MKLRRWQISLIVIALLWLAISAPFYQSGPVALFAGPLSLPFLMPTLYQRWIGEPRFRLDLRRGMTRRQVHDLADAAHPYRYDPNYSDLLDADAKQPNQGLVNVRFLSTATFCVVGGDMWIIRFDRQDRVSSWIAKPFGESC